MSEREPTPNETPQSPDANASKSVTAQTVSISGSPTERYVSRLNLLQEISQLISSNEKAEIILSKALCRLLDVLGYNAAQIYRLSPYGRNLKLFLEQGHGSKPTTQGEDTFSIEEKNIVSDAARQGRPIYISNVEKGPYSYPDNQSEGTAKVKSELAVPIHTEQNDREPELLGVLWIQSDKLDDFDETDTPLFVSCANLFGTTIKNSQMIRQLENDLQEIKNLYKLQRKENLDRQLTADNPNASLGYQYDTNALTEMDFLPAAARVASTKDELGAKAIEDDENRELVAPIKLHGETIGILGLADTLNGEEWSTDDISLLEEVSSQVALAIENSRLLQQTQEQTKELFVLFETSQQLAETGDLQHIYQILNKQIMGYLQADLCSVSLLNRTRSQFRVIAEQHRDEAGKIVTSTEPWIDHFDVDHALQQFLAKPGVMMHYPGDPNSEWNAYPDELANFNIQTLAIFPLIVKGKLVGMVMVGHLYHGRQYTPNELQLIQAIISQVVVAIENAQQFQKTEEALAETQKLYQISRALVEANTVDDVFGIVLEHVKAYEIDRASISLIDPISTISDEATSFESVTIVASWDRDSNMILPVGTQIAAAPFPLVKAFAHPPFDPLISEDLSRPEGQDERMDENFRAFMHEGLGAVTLFSTPMFLGSDYKGVLSISTRKPHTYSDQEIRVYQTLADQAIIAIENHHLFETVRHERDQAALLHKIDQTLSQAKTIEEVKKYVLSFNGSIGADHAEIYITDGSDLLTMASTLPERQSLTPDQAKLLAQTVLAEGIVAEALNRQSTLVSRRAKAPLEFENISGLSTMESATLVPFRTRLSRLRGLLIFFHSEIHGFKQDRISMVESIATQTASVLENLRLLEQTSAALSETGLLYAITRDFNAAQHPDELLAILAKSFATGETQAPITIDSMAIAIISDLAKNGVPQSLSLLAKWHNNATPAAGPARGLSKAEGSTLDTQANSHILLETKMFADDYKFISQLNARDTRIIHYYQLDEQTQTKIDSSFGAAQSILAVPLTVGNTWLGVLFLNSHQNAFIFKSSLINRTSTLASQIAVVIQNLQLVEETQQNLYNSELLSHLSQQLLVADTVEAVHTLGLDAIAATEPGRGAATFIYDQTEDGVDLEIVAAWDSPTEAWPAITPGTRLSAQQLNVTALLKSGDTVVSENVAEDDRFSETLRGLLQSMHIASFVAVPIWLKKEVNGFVLVSNQEPAAFPAESIRLYEDVARQMSGALENRRLFEEAQHRATLLETAAEVSQAATSFLDLDTLLAQSVDLIRDRFGFYHVSIFLVDEYQKYAVVKAATGDIGKKMLAIPHKLEVGGRSIVGTATATGKPRIALDVGKDGIHFKNPLLPETRSEMASPLIARGRVIGALDVQSTQRGTFADIDITILQSMANQLANAIEAAISFQDAQKALERLQKLNEYYLREQWGKYLTERRSTIGYRLTEHGPIEVQDQILIPEVNEAIEAKQPVIISPSTSPTNGENQQEPTKRVARKRSVSQLYISMPDRLTADKPSLLTAPLSLPSEVVIGALDFEISDQSTTWEEDNLRIVEAVANQAAQAVEAARLFQQTQVAREEAEALYRLGRALVTAESELKMFHTVLGEMLSILGLEQGGVLLFDPDKERKVGNLVALFVDGKPTEAGQTLPIEGNLVYERLVSTKKPVAIEDVANDPLAATAREMSRRRGVTSLLLVPIIIDDKVIGAMGADSVGDKHFFTAREINSARTMADQLSIMLQNRRLLEETHRRAVQLRTSADVSQVVTSILDQDEMLAQAAELIRERFGFYHVQIFLIDEQNKFAVLYKSAGSGAEKSRSADYKVAIGSKSVIGQATYHRKSVVIRGANPVDFDTPGYHSAYLPASQAEFAIPLQVGNALIGVLDAHSSNPADFSKDDIAILEVLAAQLAIAFQNAKAFREQQETAERLKEIDRLKTQFLANMSHELRTPLNSIIGFSRVILKGIDGPLTELQKTDLTSIHNSGQHLLSLINNILDLSKIEARKMELNFEEMEIEPIIRGVMSTAIALVKDKPVELLQDIPDDLPTIWADPTRIRQVILNLVSNACKFTDLGSVKLHAFADQTQLTVCVSDTGIGIHKDQLETIFEEFTQVDASTTRKVGGTGLGLPISRHFVEMHEGRIWVESTPGKGSTFSFNIPINQQTEQRTKQLGDTVIKADSDELEQLVLAIDDDPSVINLYERFLDKQGYRVVGISSSKDIVAQVKAHAPSAILLDILMPERDGWTVIRELKNDPLTEHIPVIICSIVSDRKRGFSLGAADYMTKPITEEDLLKALKHLDIQAKERIKVLVIDDQADDILLIRRILEAQPNYSIIEAKSGKEGLALVKSSDPDLIILDLSMPKPDGFSVVEALKNNDLTRGIPIIIVSAKELTPQESQFLTGQVEALLRKGIFTEDELLEDVISALSQIHYKDTMKF